MESFVMMRTMLGLLGASMAFGQAFDVASVRSDKVGTNEGPGRGREITKTSPGSLTMQNIRLSAAVVWAYNVKEYQVSGPAWINQERYDITAKASEAVPEAQLRLMLQTLLADRFGLSLRHETRELPVYVLLVAKGGPKFHESESTGEMAITPGGRGTFIIDVQRANIAQAVDLLYRPLQRPVLDMTGLKGRYDFKLDMTPYLAELMPAQGAKGPVGLSEIENVLMTAVQAELGLRLEARRAPIDMLVIDHAEKVPTEN